MPFGKWQDRYIEWFRDLGFLQKSGVETKATKDTTVFLTQPQRGFGPAGRNRTGGGGNSASPTNTVNSPTPGSPGAPGTSGNPPTR
jgi:hypothetical protein